MVGFVVQNGHSNVTTESGDMDRDEERSRSGGGCGGRGGGQGGSKGRRAPTGRAVGGGGGLPRRAGGCRGEESVPRRTGLVSPWQQRSLSSRTLPCAPFIQHHQKRDRRHSLLAHTYPEPCRPELSRNSPEIIVVHAIVADYLFKHRDV